MIVSALLLLATRAPRANELAKWVYEKDLSVVETPIDRRASAKAEFKATPPTFTLAKMFSETSAFSLLTFRLGDRLTKDYLDVATPNKVDDDPDATEFEAYAGSLFSATVSYVVGKDNRVKAMSYWGKRFPEDSEVYYDAIHTVLVEKLGRPTSTVKKEKEEIPYFGEYWEWSDGAYLSHITQFSDGYCAQYLYLSVAAPDAGSHTTRRAGR